MKNGAGITDTISLTQIIFSETLNHLTQLNKNKHLTQPLSTTRKLFSLYKEQIQICFATIAMGAIFLGAILIFFTQLAEYGW